MGGINWRLGKGKPGLRDVSLWDEYLKLWTIWCDCNPGALDTLRAAMRDAYVLTDRFASTPINQAHALAWLLNNR